MEPPHELFDDNVLMHLVSLALEHTRTGRHNMAYCDKKDGLVDCWTVCTRTGKPEGQSQIYKARLKPD